ncbi:hypothetical protein [Novosphingobium nitrogenifigens]|uniref:hypothetical protein n=1 Tax=Novosphingobium nitrogenifigens TaxID=378548 RepID=UPI000AB48E4C|nr:hypothetical protein [Novosphingobium nitrogenifigens]
MAECGLGIVHWCSFDWQSFSTLATGFAAVVGAVCVGMKQAGISRKQTDILDRQVELEEAKLRADLFERRMETYEVAADFVFHISSIPETDPKAEERIQRFAQKMRESQFLFSDKNVYKNMKEFWEKGNKARADKEFEFLDDKFGGDHDQDRFERILKYPIWSLETLDALADIFRKDLSILGATAAGSGPRT